MWIGAKIENLVEGARVRTIVSGLGVNEAIDGGCEIVVPAFSEGELLQVVGPSYYGSGRWDVRLRVGDAVVWWIYTAGDLHELEVWVG